MSTPTLYWKDTISDLRARALAVSAAPVDAKMSARTAAACLSGIVGLISRRWTNDVMQRTCAELVRHDPTWATSFGMLPQVNGSVSEPIQLLAVVARSLLPIAGADNLRAALSFWASEDDPATWLSVVA